MHPQDYPCTTYAVLLSSGRWAVVCEHCQRTLALCPDRAGADAIIAAHPCTTIVPTSGEVAG